MKQIILILAVMLAAQRLPAQWRLTGSSTPLMLYTNGSGDISPSYSGQTLEAGHNYTIRASSKRGFSFTGWQQVTVYRALKITYYPSGAWTTTTNVSVVTHLRTYSQSGLYFTMQPSFVMVESNKTSLTTTTRFEGWRANFESDKYPRW